MKDDDSRELISKLDRIGKELGWISLFLLVIMLVACFSGCTMIKYGELEYWRLGGQEFEDFSATKLDDGSILVEFEHYKGEDIMPTIDAIIQTAIKAAIAAGS